MLAVIGLYTSLFLTYKLLSGGKKKTVETSLVNHHSHDATNAIPSIESPEFESWIAVSGNLEKLIEG